MFRTVRRQRPPSGRVLRTGNGALNHLSTSTRPWGSNSSTTKTSKVDKSDTSDPGRLESMSRVRPMQESDLIHLPEVIVS